ncbi:DUF4834 family protein [Tenacibaculum sp. UWU-22]|uniref:DUF4834 family protein n=1 Tax=Tenacibaculum sp. UWU-22 TaxID=3234187 RepID=UPI0034DB7BB5
MGLLRTIIIFLLIYYVFKYLTRLFAPFLMKKMVDNMQERATQQYGYKQESAVKEGETIIDKKPKQASKTNDDLGEYVDFEEID